MQLEDLAKVCEARRGDWTPPNGTSESSVERLTWVRKPAYFSTSSRLQEEIENDDIHI
jgi:hypothetical protein